MDGQFNYKFNAYYSSCMEKARLTYEVHQATKSNQLKPYGHLSCMEFYLLTNIDKLEKVFLKSLGNISLKVIVTRFIMKGRGYSSKEK